jgi:hypothetical protein
MANLRSGTSLAWGTGLALLSAAFVGIVGGGSLWAVGLVTAQPGEVAIVVLGTVTVGVTVLGIAAGVAQAIDPRVIATEPLRTRDASLGHLVLVAAGPAGIGAVGLAIGFIGGWLPRAGGVIAGCIVVAAVVSWLFALLLVSRGVTSLLGLLTVRHPRVGQLVAAGVVLAAYLASQIVPRVVGRIDEGGLERLAGWYRFTPPGQLGLAMTTPATGRAAAHLVVGSIWIPLLAVGTHMAMLRLRTAQPNAASKPTGVQRSWRLIARACGGGARGALAYRTIAVRLRTPREILQTVVGGAIGLSVALGPVIATAGGTASVVLVGGAIQLAVILTSGNSLGVDGPALASEFLAGADGKLVARAKLRATYVVMSPLVLVPVFPAVATQAWHLLPAGLLVAVGAVMSGTGGAVAQSAYAPIALPESDNPFAGGDTGRGCVVGLLTGFSLFVQAMLALPIGFVLVLALLAESTLLTTVVAAASVPVGWAIARLGARLAARRIDALTPELVAEVTPSR